MALYQSKDDVPFGCFHFVVAYCLACYAMTAYPVIVSPESISIYAVLFAPILMPLFFVLGLSLRNNPEVTTTTADMMWLSGIFIVAFIASLWLVRETLVKTWIAVVVAVTLLMYFIFAAIRLA